MERPATDLRAEHGIADDQRGDRHDEPEDALGGDVGERPLRRVVDRPGEQAEQQRAAARRQHGRPPARRDARPQRVGDDGEPRRARAGGVDGASSHQLPEQALERVVEGAHLEEADAEVTRRRGAGRRRARALRGLDDDPVSSPSNVTPTTESRPISADGQAPAGVGAHEHMTRAVVHRVADRPVAAGGGEPPVDEHDDPLGEPLDLVAARAS